MKKSINGRARIIVWYIDIKTNRVSIIPASSNRLPPPPSNLSPPPSLTTPADAAGEKSFDSSFFSGCGEIFQIDNFLEAL
jgi:hypothetical protein